MKKTKRAYTKQTNIVPLTQTPKIEKGIPIPPRSNQFGFAAEMKPGDSFYLPASIWNITKAVQSVRSWGYPYKIYFTVRRDEKGARIWRI